MFKLLDGFKFFLDPAWVANIFFTLWGKGGGGGGGNLGGSGASLGVSGTLGV